METIINKKTLEDALQAKTVAELYGSEAKGTQKFQRAPSRKKNYLAFIGISVLLIAAGLAWTGFNLFNSQTAFRQDNVTLDVKAPAEAASGETITYRIEYQNNDENAFSESSVDVVYPQGFTVTETTPSAANDEKTHWNLGLVKSREQGVIEIKGQITGKSDEAKTVTATITYHPIRASKPVELKKGATTTINSSVLQLEIKGPNQVVAGEHAVYRILYKNFANIENKDKVVLNVHYPDGFVFVESNPRPDDGQGTWNANTLLSALQSDSSTGAIEITGVVNSAQGSNNAINAQIGFKNGDTVTVENEQNLATQVATGDLIVSMKVNGSEDNGTAHFGDTLKVAISYENRGSNTLSGVTLRANIDGDVVDWTNYKDDNNGAFTAGQVTWTSNEIPALSQLLPQSKGTIETTIHLQSSDAAKNLRLSGATDVAVKMWASADVSGVISPDGMPLPQDSNNQSSKSGTITYTLGTNLSFSSQLRYFSDDSTSIGAGPLPPKVGETTTYHVQWKASNTLHDADDILARTTLPDYVTWIARSNASVGDISYNNTTREVTWHISRLGAGSGETASFDIQYKARTEDLNKIIPVTNETTLSGKDTTTNKLINLRQTALTTNLDFDPVGKGRGLVVQ